MATTTTDSTQAANAEKLVAAVSEFRSLVERFHAEGHDEMFVSALDGELFQWEGTARAELAEAKQS